MIGSVLTTGISDVIDVRTVEESGFNPFLCLCAHCTYSENKMRPRQKIQNYLTAEPRFVFRWAVVAIGRQ